MLVNRYPGKNELLIHCEMHICAACSCTIAKYSNTAH